MKNIVLIAHNIRSSHNVGSLIRTSEGLGVNSIYLTGYTPYLKVDEDQRIPHLATKIDSRIKKTSLGAEQTINVIHEENVLSVLQKLKNDGYELVGLEQSDDAINIKDFEPGSKIAILIGNEVEGIDKDLMKDLDTLVEIPMFGQKESFNVVQATAMILFFITLIA